MRLSLFCFNAVYTTTTRTTSLFVRIAPPPWSTIPLRPSHFFFPRQRDFFIPARYPRGLDSLTLRGQKKEEGGGEKKGAERDRGREREEKICHDLSSSEQKCSLPLKRPLKPSRVNLFSCSGFFFSLLFSPPPFFLLFLSLSLQNIFRGFLLIVLSAKNCPFKVGCAF